MTIELRALMEELKHCSEFQVWECMVERKKRTPSIGLWGDMKLNGTRCIKCRIIYSKDQGMQVTVVRRTIRQLMASLFFVLAHSNIGCQIFLNAL